MNKCGFRGAVGGTLGAVLVVAGSLCFNGCSDFSEGEFKPNQPPEVWLSSAPPEGSTDKYTIKMFWGGWDPDGEISHYEFAITDNVGGTFDPADTTGRDKWSKVYGNDSTFMFTADMPADPNPRNMVAEFLRPHTFFIRAVDNEGLASREPAYRTFTARTLSPKVTVTIPPGGTLSPSFVPPITNFRWVAEDYIEDMTSILEPDSVSWILEPIRKHEQSFDKTIEWIRRLPVDSQEWYKWGGWKWYKAPEDAGKSWTTPPLDFEAYVFAIRAKDEAGAITAVFDQLSNVRRIHVSQRSTGPIFTVRNIYLGAVTTAICHEPVTIMDIPAGVSVGFSWEASADHYGGIVSGYRYGWDIADLSDPDQWEVDYTPFTSPWASSPPRTFFFGTHVFSVEVIDNSGYCSRIETKVNVIQFTMDNNLLVVDDYTEGTRLGWDDPLAPGLTPNDQQHDLFWELILENVAGFNAGGDILNVRTGDVVPLVNLAQYKSIIWSVYGNVDVIAGPVLHDYIRHRPTTASGGGGKRQPNVLALFMAAGGHLFICGNHPVSLGLMGTGLRFPVVFKYELEFNQTQVPTAATVPVGINSFVCKELCLETMDFAYTDYKRRRGPGLYCPVHTVRKVPPNALRDHTMRAAMPLDLDFPRLELRYEAAGPGRAYHESKKGWDAEVYNPGYFFNLCRYVAGQRGCFEPIYALDCLDKAEPTYGAPVAFWTSAFADRIAGADGAVGARSVVFGFPPVYFKPEQVQAAIETIVFDEWQLPRK